MCSVFVGGGLHLRGLVGRSIDGGARVWVTGFGRRRNMGTVFVVCGGARRRFRR